MATSTGVFRFDSPDLAADQLVVLGFRGEEAASDLYSFRLECRVAMDPDFLYGMEASLLGKRAKLEIHPGGVPRVAHGVVSAFRILPPPADPTQSLVEVELVPKLWMTTLRTFSQVFQSMTVPQIVSAVLGEWQIKHHFDLTRQYTPRTFCLQYQETDYQFLTRILADEGIFFFFDHSGDEEEMMLLDAPIYPVISGSPLLRHSTSRFGADEHEIAGLTLARTLRPKMATLSDFDFRRPDHPLGGASNADLHPIGSKVDLDTTAHRAYLHRDGPEVDAGTGAAEVNDMRAHVVLEQLRRDRYVLSAATRCGRLIPGCMFRVDEHPTVRLNIDLVVRRVVHRGRLPESPTGLATDSPATDSPGTDSVYTNEIECMPAEMILRPPHHPSRPRQVSETATVVGPDGEEIYTDTFGRVRIQFHWDTKGKDTEKSSCWVRCAMPWAGTGFGSQFVPRVGMEVVVTFLGGDVDRPMITGCVYNATHPVPFALPGERTKSGFRTQSSPGGDGFNELSFEDKKGGEQIYLHAERDFAEEIERDHSTKVKGNQIVVVDGGHTTTVKGPSALTFIGGLEETVTLDARRTVAGTSLESYAQSADVRVGGDRTIRVEGRDQQDIVGGSIVTNEADAITRIAGHLVTVVGRNDARKSSFIHVEGTSQMYSSGPTEIVAEKEIVLRCGESVLRLLPDAIEIISPTIRVTADEIAARASKKIRIDTKEEFRVVSEKDLVLVGEKKISMKGEKGQMLLDQNARIDGTLVKLNCSPDPVDDKKPEEKEPKKPTKFSLKDQDGKPLAKQRFVIVSADGSERLGYLDHEGKAEVHLEESGEVIFPDVDKARKG